MARWIPLLLLAACSAAEPAPVRVTAAPEAAVNASASPARETFAVEPELAEPALAALELWTEASGGEYAPELIVGTVPGATRIELVDFGTDDVHAGGWSRSSDTIQISLRVTPEKLVSTIAHEIGHREGLVHEVGTGGLMDPDRPATARLHPCVSAKDVASLGFSGPGSCLE